MFCQEISLVCYQSILNDTEETKAAGPSGPRISTGPAGRSLFSLTGPTVKILATGQRLRRTLHHYLLSLLKLVVVCNLRFLFIFVHKTLNWFNMNRKPVCGDCACQYTFFLSQGTFRPSDLTLSTAHWSLSVSINYPLIIMFTKNKTN